MFLEITDVILIALFIEAIVNAIKPIWTKGETQLTVSEYVSMGMGVLLAVTCKINMLAYVVEADYPMWVEYIFYALTGIAIGRGTNFLYDLWNKLKEWQSGQLLPAVEVEDAVELTGEEFDMEITHWPLEMIIGFARANGFALPGNMPVSYTHLRAHETGRNLVCRLLLEKKKKMKQNKKNKKQKNKSAKD